MIDIDLDLDLFSPKRKKANDKCLDYEDFIRLTDKEAREEITNLQIKNISVLQHLDKIFKDYDNDRVYIDVYADDEYKGSYTRYYDDRHDESEES